MKTGFILPNGETIEFEYKNLGIMVEKFINLYKEEPEYKEFVKSYSFISPDFYYLILKKDFQIINPFMKKNTVAKGHGSLIMVKNIETKKSEFYITPTTEHLKIKQFDNNIIDGFISPNGISLSTFDLVDGLEMGHPKISDCVINDAIIKDPNIYDKYIESFDEENSLNYGTIFLVNELGFVICDLYKSNVGYISYNKDVVNQSIIDDITLNNDCFSLIIDDGSDLAKTK